MKILHTVEFYSPNVGGTEEVVRQLSERLVERGHEVTVAATYNPARKTKIINGVHIEEFDVSGNAVSGMRGEVERYQRFLKSGNFDVMMNYAAQQWASDAVFPVLSQLPYKKVLVPCGFSYLYDPKYAAYFKDMPSVLMQYDHLVFPADDYRDVNFARQHKIQNWSLIPNGASERAFAVRDTTFRSRYNIPEDAIVLLTVGTHNAMKGHALVLDALEKIGTEKTIVLLIIGSALKFDGVPSAAAAKVKVWRAHFREFVQMAKKANFGLIVKKMKAQILSKSFARLPEPGCIQDCRDRASRINLSGAKKRRVLLLSPPDEEVVAAYHAADLFVFGSNIEHSPLVLYQAMASKTPFLSLACGNAAEIARWSGGGKIAPTYVMQNGMVYGDPQTFADEITALLQNPREMKELAENGYAKWRERFTWEKIAIQYEDLYRNLMR